MSTWVECEDGTWVNLDRVERIAVRTVKRATVGDVFMVGFEQTSGLAVHSRHASLDAAEATIGRFLAASGTRCLRRGV